MPTGNSHNDDVDEDSDDMPQLSAEAVNALAEFYDEMNDKVTIREDWQVRQSWINMVSKLTCSLQSKSS